MAQVLGETSAVMQGGAVAQAACEARMGTWNALTQTCIGKIGPMVNFEVEADLPGMCAQAGGIWDADKKSCKESVAPPSWSGTTWLLLGVAAIGAAVYVGFKGNKKTYTRNGRRRARRNSWDTDFDRLKACKSENKSLRLKLGSR